LKKKKKKKKKNGNDNKKNLKYLVNTFKLLDFKKGNRHIMLF
jgi:hypothetical protein